MFELNNVEQKIRIFSGSIQEGLWCGLNWKDTSYRYQLKYMWLWGGVVDGFDSTVAARGDWPGTRASTPFLSEQIRLNWGWENIFPKFIRQMRAYRAAEKCKTRDKKVI